MSRDLSYRLSVLAAAILMAVISIASAAQMGPRDADRPEVIALVAIGGTVADICDDTPAPNHAEHCPFCHTTAQADPVAPTGQIWTLLPEAPLLATADLVANGQLDRARHWARGPPVLA
ncbi:MAG: hypothetical protein P8J02_13880 [Yoonia sp.]|nr:hypothetical protein [Yoonia sp.]